VTLAEDFTGVTLAQENPTHRCVKLYLEEANLTYVAFTRARDTLVKGAFTEALERQKDLARALKAGKLQLCTPEIEAQARKAEPRVPEVVVELPPGMYVNSLKDIEVLIGRRAEQDLLHPRTGKVLVEQGKIITRSTVKQLENQVAIFVGFSSTAQSGPMSR